MMVPGQKSLQSIYSQINKIVQFGDNMATHTYSPFQAAIDAVEALPVEDRRDLLEILRARMAEDKREEIAANAAETLAAVREYRARFGDLEELKKDLLDD
jgi:acyl-CoA reductase-like NAD-dependent aldehyde dehydrogenase